MSCFLREKYNPYDLSSPTAGRSEEQRSKQASHVSASHVSHPLCSPTISTLPVELPVHSDPPAFSNVRR